jgi:hypothetical protein
MTDVEELLRRSLARHVADAPSGSELPEKVRRRRRRGAIATSLATVVVLALAGTAVALDLSNPPVHSEVLTLPPSMTPPPAYQARVLAFHGIDITVPASWGTNQSECGVPSADTVVLDGFGDADDCPPQTYPSGVSEVRLSPTAAGDTAEGRQRERAGQRQIVSYPRSPYGHRTMRVVIPTVGVTVTIDAPGITANQIANSIRVTSHSPEGCLMHEDHIAMLRDPGFDRAQVRRGSSQDLIPPGPSSVRLCQYAQTWLLASTRIRGVAARNLALTLNRAPRGSGVADGENCLQTPPGDGFELAANYRAGPTVFVSLDEDCGVTEATNGSRHAHLGPQQARAITEPLHSDF